MELIERNLATKLIRASLSATAYRLALLLVSDRYLQEASDSKASGPWRFALYMSSLQCDKDVALQAAQELVNAGLITYDKVKQEYTVNYHLGGKRAESANLSLAETGNTGPEGNQKPTANQPESNEKAHSISSINISKETKSQPGTGEVNAKPMPGQAELPELATAHEVETQDASATLKAREQALAKVQHLDAQYQRLKARVHAARANGTAADSVILAIADGILYVASKFGNAVAAEAVRESVDKMKNFNGKPDKVVNYVKRCAETAVMRGTGDQREVSGGNEYEGRV